MGYYEFIVMTACPPQRLWKEWVSVDIDEISDSLWFR